MYYAVLNFKDGNGKRKQKWISTGLEVKNNKRKAEQALNKLIAEYEKTKIIVSDKQKFTVFMEEWLKTIKIILSPQHTMDIVSTLTSILSHFLISLM